MCGDSGSPAAIASRESSSSYVAAVARPGFPPRGGILDTETTGLNHRKDEIIEIGAVAFTFDAAGTIGDIIGFMVACSNRALQFLPRSRA
ncbi:exonuclease [Sinorhizobium medicae]|nr:exonuclease [Sinorhizobium medicae]